MKFIAVIDGTLNLLNPIPRPFPPYKLLFTYSHLCGITDYTAAIIWNEKLTAYAPNGREIQVTDGDV